jgi:hypothetical protein
VLAGGAGRPRQGEGEPRPAVVGAAEAAAVEQAAAPEVSSKPPPLPVTQPTPSAKAGWRMAFIILVVLAVVTCLTSIVAFLIFGSTPSETTTPQEDWLYAAFCCLLPIGGAGAILGGIGGFIWYTRLRER